MRLYARTAVAALASVWLLGGCEGTLPPKEGGTPAEVVEKSADQGQGKGAGGAAGGATTQALPSSGGWKGSPLDDPNSLLSKRVVYFDFDSASIRPEDRPILEAHAQYLAGDANASVVLEGNTDERGSREYNIGLGERRADAVRRLLTLLGASDGQIRTVSYGEERPVALGHDESAWAQNRRVDLNYQR